MDRDKGSLTTVSRSRECHGLSSSLSPRMDGVKAIAIAVWTGLKENKRVKRRLKMSLAVMRDREQLNRWWRRTMSMTLTFEIASFVTDNTSGCWSCLADSPSSCLRSSLVFAQRSRVPSSGKVDNGWNDNVT